MYKDGAKYYTVDGVCGKFLSYNCFNATITLLMERGCPDVEYPAEKCIPYEPKPVDSNTAFLKQNISKYLPDEVKI
jgi:hypothetical protein